jgi:hypothetical protein
VYNNTSYNNKGAAFRTRDASGFDFKNNIGYQTSGPAFQSEAVGATSNTLDYNLWYGSTNIYSWDSANYSNPKSFNLATGQGLHDISVNPLFTNDYRLQDNSPACNNGENGNYIGAYTCDVSTVKIGDINADSFVDIFDFNKVISNFGRTGTFGFIPSDIDNNGEINIFDYFLVVENFMK